MRISQSTTVKNQPGFATPAAVKYKRRVERAEKARRKHVTYTDPATGRIQAINIRHN